MNRVRRQHFRHASTRPAARARRPLTELITAGEGLKMFDAGVEIGERRGERGAEYDHGFLDGYKLGVKHAREAAGGSDD